MMSSFNAVGCLMLTANKQLSEATPLPDEVKDIGINIFTDRRTAQGLHPRVVSTHTIMDLIGKLSKLNFTEEI